MCKSRLSRGKVDAWQRPFYDDFWVSSCFEVLFEFQKALLKNSYQYQYMDDCPYTPPLAQQSIDNKLGLMLG